MSYVDLMSDARWSEADHVERVEAFVRSRVTHVREHVLSRRSIAFTFYMLSQMLPTGHPAKPLMAQFGKPMSEAAMNELAAAADVFLQADDLAIQARADSSLLDRALDYEAIRAKFDALPTVPEEGEDPDAQARIDLASEMAAFDSDALDLVHQRDLYKGITS